MLEKLYTTKMTGNAKTLRKRFSKIRSKQGRASRAAAAAAAVTLSCTAVFATVVMAAVDGRDVPNGQLIINGSSSGVDIVKIPTVLTTDTDSYYIPIREVFEKLGYTIVYDVDRKKYADIIGIHPEDTFPSYDDRSGRQAENYLNWRKGLVANETDNYIYGQTSWYNQFPLIEVTAPNGDVLLWQVGCQHGFHFSGPVMIDSTVYVPVRELAYTLGGYDNLKWDDAAHDTYYEGVVDFNKEDLVITIEY